MQQHYLKAGTVDAYSQKQFARAPIVGFHFESWLREALRTLHVDYSDPCCVDPGNTMPVRYNPATGGFEAHDGTDWIAI